MEVTQRFLKYVSFDTTSSEMSDTVPTTDHQKVLGRYLAQELAELGLEGAHMDDNGYVYALLPATPGCQAPALGLIAHMDTSPAVSGADIHPEIVTYQGGDLPLKKAGSLKVKDFPFLERYIGQELIVTEAPPCWEPTQGGRGGDRHRLRISAGPSGGPAPGHRRVLHPRRGGGQGRRSL